MCSGFSIFLFFQWVVVANDANLGRSFKRVAVCIELLFHLRLETEYSIVSVDLKLIRGCFGSASGESSELSSEKSLKSFFLIDFGFYGPRCL